MHRKRAIVPICKRIVPAVLLAASTFGCDDETGNQDIRTSASALVETIDFAGYSWRVRTGYCSVGNTAGPGANYWCGDAEDVWVDAQGRLHLKINYKSSLEAYAAVEVETDVAGCGVYSFTVVGDSNGTPDGFDENMVLGMFSYSSDAEEEYHEIDIEISDWGDTTPSNNLFYTTWNDSGYTQDAFDVLFGSGDTVHSFDWAPNQLTFSSIKNSVPITSGGSRTGSAVYLCPTSSITARINLWMYQGVQPDSAQEVVISDFSFTPYVDLIAPTGLSAVAEGATAIALEWMDNALAEEGYEIERKIGSGSFVELDTVGPDVETYSDTDLDPGTTAIYRVRAVQGTSTGSYSTEASATTESVPTLDEISYDFAGWSGYVAGEIQDMPSGSFHVRSWVYITGDLVYTQGSDLSPTAAGVFNAQYPGLWGSDDGREIYVTLHPAATDQYGTSSKGNNIPTWNWPEGLYGDVTVFGPFETGL